jgi:hypothetical protein
MGFILTSPTLQSTDELPQGNINLYFTDEASQDAIAGLFQNGTGISWSYDDANNLLTPTVTLAPFSTDDLAEGANLYYSTTRFDERLALKTTSDLAEGSNLYYTTARFDSRLALKTTSDLAEGSNLYYTAARFNTAFAAKSTTDLAEGSKLFFTTARAQGAVSASAPIAYSGGVFSIQQADATHDGYLSSGDFTTFSAKVSGSGLTSGKMARITGSSTIGNGKLTEDANGALSTTITGGSATALTIDNGSTAVDLLDLQHSASSVLTVSSAGTLTLKASSAANLRWNTDGGGDIGTSSGNRPRDIFATRLMRLPSTALNGYYLDTLRRGLHMDGSGGAAEIYRSGNALLSLADGQYLVCDGPGNIWVFYNADTGTALMTINRGTGKVTANDLVVGKTGLGVGNSAAATTLGTVVKKMEVFAVNGTSLGFVPIYDSIT